MKKLTIILGLVIIFSSCGAPSPQDEKIGNHDLFLRTLSNGDSLFKSYYIDSSGYWRDVIYYTKGASIKSIDWEVRNGKSIRLESIIKK